MAPSAGLPASIDGPCRFRDAPYCGAFFIWTLKDEWPRKHTEIHGKKTSGISYRNDARHPAHAGIQPFNHMDDSLRSPYGPPLRAFNALRAFVRHAPE